MQYASSTNSTIFYQTQTHTHTYTYTYTHKHTLTDGWPGLVQELVGTVRYQHHRRVCALCRQVAKQVEGGRIGLRVCVCVCECVGDDVGRR